MKYLVDTQILLWTITKNARLSRKILTLFKNDLGEDRFYFSQISLFEIAIKQKIGKLSEINIDIMLIYRQLIADGYDFLPIANAHIACYHQVPLYDNHRDPFDRLLLATAMEEKMTLVSADEKFRQYANLVDLFEVV